MPSDEDRATGNMHKKCGEVWPCSFRVMRADIQMHRQTNTQTYSSQYFTTLPGWSNMGQKQ